MLAMPTEELATIEATTPEATLATQENRPETKVERQNILADEAPKSHEEQPQKTLQDQSEEIQQGQSQQDRPQQTQPAAHEDKNENLVVFEEVASDSHLAKEQLKHCQNILRGLKRHRDAGPFQKPVDSDALGIPEYRNIIKHPMDISTIASKLERGVYGCARGFVADVRLMLDNCFTFNPPETVVHQMGRNLEKYFEGAVAKIPRREEDLLQHQQPAQKTTGKKDEATASLVTPPAPRRQFSSFSGSSSQQLQPPNRSAMGKSDIAQANAIMRELLKKTNQVVTWPFLQPVDPIALGIPDYFDVIQDPMDLSTMRNKLENGRYRSLGEFEGDFRLMIANCRTYNPPETEVVRMAVETEALFEQAKRQVSQKSSGSGTASPGAHKRKNSAQYSNTAAPAYGSGSLNGLSDTDKILAINRQIQALQNELNDLLMKRNSPSGSSVAFSRKRSASHQATPQPSQQSSSTSTVSTASPSAAQQVAKPKKANLDDVPLSYEEKRVLSVDVSNLAAEKLPRLLEIIQQTMPELPGGNNGQDDVIELDIEALGTKTLRALQKYVKECNKKVKKQPSSTVSSSQIPQASGPSQQNQPSSGPLSSKPTPPNQHQQPVAHEQTMDEEDEE